MTFSLAAIIYTDTGNFARQTPGNESGKLFPTLETAESQGYIKPESLIN